MRSVFVIHAHSGYGPLHYDLMIRRGPALASWRLACVPDEPDPPGPMQATRLPDHRLAYLDCEGPVSGNRGSVARVDKGPCELIETGPTTWEVRLRGERVRGRFELRHRGPDERDWALRRLTDD